MGTLFRQAQRDAEGDANAHRDRYRRRVRDWPDLVGCSDVRVGPRGQRALGTRTQNAPVAGGRHVEKIVLLCFLIAAIGVLAEWSRAPQASRPGGHPSPGPRSPS